MVTQVRGVAIYKRGVVTSAVVVVINSGNAW